MHQTGTQDEWGWWGLQVPKQVADAINKAIPQNKRGIGDLTVVLKPTRRGMREIQRPGHDTATITRDGVVTTEQTLNGYMFGDAGEKV